MYAFWGDFPCAVQIHGSHDFCFIMTRAMHFFLYFNFYVLEFWQLVICKADKGLFLIHWETAQKVKKDENYLFMKSVPILNN